MSWLTDMRLKDLDESQFLEATCIRCLHTWLQSPTHLLIKVAHRDVYLDEVAEASCMSTLGVSAYWCPLGACSQ